MRFIFSAACYNQPILFEWFQVEILGLIWYLCAFFLMQVMSQEIQEAVYKQQEVIKDKQLRVKQDLDQVEPAVIEAQNGKAGLGEMRDLMGHPHVSGNDHAVLGTLWQTF